MSVNGISNVGANAYEALTTTQTENKPVEEVKDNTSEKGENGVVYEPSKDSVNVPVKKYVQNTELVDELAIGMVNQKTTAVRIIPLIGKTVGDSVEFGGLLGYAPIMPVNKYSCDAFVNRGGRIPAPIHSFKN